MDLFSITEDEAYINKKIKILELIFDDPEMGKMINAPLDDFANYMETMPIEQLVEATLILMNLQRVGNSLIKWTLYGPRSDQVAELLAHKLINKIK